MSDEEDEMGRRRGTGREGWEGEGWEGGGLEGELELELEAGTGGLLAGHAGVGSVVGTGVEGEVPTLEGGHGAGGAAAAVVGQHREGAGHITLIDIDAVLPAVDLEGGTTEIE